MGGVLLLDYNLELAQINLFILNDLEFSHKATGEHWEMKLIAKGDVPS